MVTRAKTLKPTITETPFVETAQAAPTPEYNSRDYLHNLLDQALNEGPGWKRIVLAFIASIAVAAGGGYLAGYAVMAIAIGAALVTGSMIAFYITAMLGLLLSMYACSKISVFTYNSIIDRSVDRAYTNTKNTVCGWFSKTPTAAPVAA